MRTRPPSRLRPEGKLRVTRERQTYRGRETAESGRHSQVHRRKKPRTLFIRYGAGYWRPTRPTSSTSSSYPTAGRFRSLILRLTLRQKGLKDSFGCFAAWTPPSIGSL